jgi:hypothetical protein
MGLIDRSTNGSEHVVVLRYVALANWLRWLVLLILLVNISQPSKIAIYAAVVAFVAMLAFAVPYWPVMQEINRRMRAGSVTASGSRYSLSNPLTYRWSESPEQVSH